MAMDTRVCKCVCVRVCECRVSPSIDASIPTPKYAYTSIRTYTCVRLYMDTYPYIYKHTFINLYITICLYSCPNIHISIHTGEYSYRNTWM